VQLREAAAPLAKPQPGRAEPARSGNPDAAKADIAKLAELREKLRTAKDAYWAEQVDIQWQVATAWALYAEGKYEDAPNAMSGAADAEDKTDKHPVTPGVPTPARELYGLMLLEHARKDDTRRSLEAEQVFRKHSAKCSIASYIRPIG
jgi:hypothetical protein